jgi:cytochrome c
MKHMKGGCRPNPWLAWLAAAVVACGAGARAELRGHGGPVRAVAITPDGRTAVSGSFDQSVIVWSIDGETALEVLRFHAGSVNAAVALADDRFATGGEDGRIALWRRGQSSPAGLIGGHAGPIAALAVSPDGRLLASASWDETVRVTDLADGRQREFAGHQGNVNGVSFTPDGRSVVSAGYDATLRIWPLDGGATPVVARLATPLHGVGAFGEEILTAGGDGRIYAVDPDGRVSREFPAHLTPITALAFSRDGRLLASAGIKGQVVVLERATGRVVIRLGETGAPAWSLAFTPDGRELLVGGGDRLIRRWNVSTGRLLGAAALPDDEPAIAAADERGARVFRACAACHTLTPDGGNRAGPTLFGVFGRRIATAPGYNYSEALRRLDIVWTAETVARLFEIGPNTYTPGTKMPEQTIGSAEDRAALVRFLEQATTRR